MAAYHFTAKIHSRGKGASAVRAAAYRAAERLYDARAGVTEDYTRKADVVESAILLPAGAPAWMQNRNELWNRVEARERRKDAQVAQELEINLPRELSDAENWRLITDFAREHLTACGRVCDLAMHVHTAADGSEHPHAHILMPLRSIAGDGFGEKHPDVDWRKFLDRRDRLEELRELWCSFARDRAASLGVELGADWDHRSFADRGIDLEAQPKLGAAAQRLAGEGSAPDRLSEQEKTRAANGARLLARPEIVLEALTSRQSTFTKADVARWVHRHAPDEHFAAIMDKACARAVVVGLDGERRERLSTPEMIALERRMIRDAGELAGRAAHRVSGSIGRLAQTRLSAEQQIAAHTLLDGGDLACLVGHAGAGKSTLLTEVRRELEAKGFTVRGAALSGIAAQNLTEGSGIEARTLHSLQYAWEQGRSRLTKNDVLVIDEAGMVGSRQLARFIAEAGDVGAKVILVGDPEQLQAIEAGAAFRAIAGRVPTAALTEIRRQQIDWQRQATRELASADTVAALARYRAAGCVETTTTDAVARARLVALWQNSRAESRQADQQEKPAKSRIMLAHTRADVRDLNQKARSTMRLTGELGPDVGIETVNGPLAFSTGDRLLFLRNERQLGVKNGTLGTIEAATPERLKVRTDDGRLIEVDPSSYRDLGHGYATTIHKAQGVTVDQTFVLATPGFDRHLTYVACSRHRERLTIVHSDESFASRAQFDLALGRERAKDTTLDYLLEDVEDLAVAADRRPAVSPPPPLTQARLNTPAPAPRPTQAFIDACQPVVPAAARAPAIPDPVPTRPMLPPNRSQSPEPEASTAASPSLTDLERAFIQQRDAAPSLEQAFRLKRDRGPRLGR